ncbi:MAG TPA: DUF493 family protein [Burkholderiaceae bacterium]|nr:DUF493 family protein [Burkholderiaceae bacterium]
MSDPSPAAPRESAIRFPLDFPIKVMGLQADGFAQAIVSVVQTHAPDFDATTLEQRASREGRYVSLTVTVRASSQAQLDALYRALTSHPMVKFVL